MGKHTWSEWSDRRAKSMDWVGSLLAGLPSLLDGLLDGHIYRVVRWVQINQLLESSRTSSSECLFSEGQTQERRRFYNGSVKQRRAPRFTGEGRRYATVIQTFIRKSDLLPTRSLLTRQWRLVTIRIALRLPEYGASEASTPSMMNLCSPIIQVTFFTILVGSRRVAQKNSRF
jgi:hypothetical protein